jgi:hypothetical protein
MKSARPLPRLCTKCGESGSLVERRLPFGIRRRPVTVPLCTPCNRRWGYAWTVRGLFVYASLLNVLPTAIWVFSTDPFVRGALLVPTLGVWLTILALWAAKRFTRRHWLGGWSLEGGALVLRGVAPAMVEAVAPPRGGLRAQSAWRPGRRSIVQR